MFKQAVATNQSTATRLAKISLASVAAMKNKLYSRQAALLAAKASRKAAEDAARKQQANLQKQLKQARIELLDARSKLAKASRDKVAAEKGVVALKVRRIHVFA